MFTISWDENQRSNAPSAADVERCLDELHRRYCGGDPQLVTVEVNDTGDSLAIGLGRNRSILNYVAGSKDPPYFTSVGELDSEEAITFRFNGDLSEFPERNTIPIRVARDVMRHFCATGKLSTTIAWEED